MADDHGDDSKDLDKDKSKDGAPAPFTLHTRVHTKSPANINTYNIGGDAQFQATFANNKDSLTPKKEESIWLYFLKNPDKVRDWAIALFFLWAMITGGLSVADLLKLVKGDKSEKPVPAQVTP